MTELSDRELLGLAAKAAGFDATDWLGGDDWMNVYYGKGKHSCWNPLTDDGDALRLAAKVGMLVDIRYGRREGMHLVCVTYWIEPHFGKSISQCGEDQLECARRCIVLAAAAIGASMP